MTLDPRETLREVSLQSQLVALGAALESAAATHNGQSLAHAAFELRRMAEQADAREEGAVGQAGSLRRIGNPPSAT